MDGSTVAQRLIVFVLGGPGSGKGTQVSAIEIVRKRNFAFICFSGPLLSTI